MVFTERSFHLCGSGKYTHVLCFRIKGDEAGAPAPSRTRGCGGFPGTVSDMLDHHSVSVCSHFCNSEVK